MLSGSRASHPIASESGKAPSRSDRRRGERSFAGALPALLMLALALAVVTTMLGMFSAVQEAAKAEMRLSDFQLGMAQGVAAAIPLVLLSIPVGIVVDRRNRIRLMILLVAAATLGAVLTAFAQGMILLFAARMLLALAANAAVTACISIGADLCPPARRGASMLVLTLGKWAGSAGAFAAGGWLLGLFAGGIPVWLHVAAPWRAAHLVLAAAGAITIIVLLALREPARRETEAGPQAPLSIVARELWARRAFVLPLFAGQISVFMADSAATIWAAPVLTRSYGLQPPQFASWMGLVVFAAGVSGSLLGGIGADLGQKSGRRGGIMTAAVLFAALSIPVALFPIAPSVPLFAAALGLFLLSGTVTGLVTATAITVVLPNELRGLCTGLFVALAGLLAFGVAPTAVTLTSSLLGGEAHLGGALAIVGFAVSLLSFGAFLRAMRQMPDA